MKIDLKQSLSKKCDAKIVQADNWWNKTERGGNITGERRISDESSKIL